MHHPPASIPEVPPIIVDFCRALERSGYQGECALDDGTRVLYGTDNSIYQVIPQAVLYPKTRDDLNAILSVAQRDSFAAIQFMPRGGGTGTNGQSLNTCVVIDTSRHLNRIIAIDWDNHTVRVEPGVVLDQLNAILKPQGFFFPPEISPGKSATLGGMVSTDACGKGSCVYGKTGDYIVSLTCILSDGREIKTHEYAPEALRELLHSNYDQACELAPTMPRGLSAYNIPASYDPQTGCVNLNRLIAGSEGSLVVIKDITLRIVPRPTHKAVFAVGYDNFDTALRHVRTLITCAPTAIETIDDHILKLARGDVVWPVIAKTLSFLETGKPILGLHFVEIEAHSSDDLVQKVAHTKTILDATETVAGYHLTTDIREMASIAALRRKCVGLLGNMEGARRPIPFIEDTAVPPENLADYIADLRVLLDGHELQYGMFGHSDAGCLHVRPVLDMRQERDEYFIRTLTDSVVLLLKKHHGILWGEHGKGMRSEYTDALMGGTYYALMQKVKQYFDPHNRFNPGKIATIMGGDLTKIDDVPLRGHFDRQITPDNLKGFEKSVECNGNGMCFSVMPDDTMCPSYKITKDRMQSPKGRAGVIREWLRLKSIGSPKTKEFSKTVYKSLHGCLSCKACTSSCPIHVNIPQMKSNFLHEYHTYTKRRVRDYLLANVERLMPFQFLVPSLVYGLFGLRDLPKKSGTSLRHLMHKYQFSYLSKTSILDTQKSVLIIQDAFTSHYEPETVLAILQLIRKAGYEPIVVPLFESGKSWHGLGFLATFKTIADKNIKHLKTLLESGVPMVGIDPSITLIYRDEYQKIHHGDLGYRISMLHEWLDMIDLPRAQRTDQSYQLMMHCSEKSGLSTSGDIWVRIFSKCGVTLNVIETGCCGMAGSYGHESEHYEYSKGLYALSWQGRVSDSSAVTGFSCRSQIKRLTQHKPRHPLSILNDLL